ncbi:MAG: dephospho-CoA kinase [Pseudomonadota bacterium]
MSGDNHPAPSIKPLIIGVTGGMASGKSTLARMFAGRGILHLDADTIVHDLMRNDRDTIAAIAAVFPEAVTSPHTVTPSHDGAHLSSVVQMDPVMRRGDSVSIDRARLAAHITRHPEALATLETILHPRVRAVEESTIAAARRNRLRAVILDIPLLFETDAHQLCDIVIVAHAPLHHRRTRAFARPGMTEEKWQRLLARQLPAPIRNAAADIVIPTAIGKAATRRIVMALMREWGL